MNTTANTPATDIMNHPQIIWLREQLEAHGGNKTALAHTLGDVISSKTIGLLLEGRYQYNVEGMLKKLKEQQERLNGQLPAAAAADLGTHTHPHDGSNLGCFRCRQIRPPRQHCGRQIADRQNHRRTSI